MRVYSVAVAIACCLSCAGEGGTSRNSSPSTPTTPTPSAWTLSGVVTDTAAGGPVAGATIEVAGHPPVISNGDGRWEIRATSPPALRPGVKISAPGYISRDTFVTWGARDRSDVSIDLIAERVPFALDFYRAFVRNGFEEPQALQFIRRWTSDPSFYINTFNPKTGRPLEPQEIDLVIETLRASVPQLTGGLLKTAAVEVGDGPRDARPGFIAVQFIYEPDGEFCGQARVGADPGEITINYDRCAVLCGSLKVTPETIAHEVGHAMGFWHTTGQGVMSPTRRRNCRGVQFSDTERFHAAIAYKRPRGNLDIDRDPTSFAAIAAPGGDVVIRCPASAAAR